MKLYIILTIFLTFCAALSPFAVLAPKSSEKRTEKETTVLEQSSVTQETNSEETIRVFRASSGKVIEKNISAYIIGAVSAEISPEYEAEAIKAQAVVCYTYALWLKQNSDSKNIKGADISDNSEKHQGFLETDELRKKWGKRYDEYLKKITDCVNSVSGKYLEYNNEPIMACFHAISTGKTESAKNAWGNDVPYLQSVTANGDLLSPEIDSEVVLSDSEFKKCAEKLGNIKLPKDSSNWLGKTKATKSGLVTSIVIGSKEFSGSDIRSAFSLRSPAFTVKKTSHGFIFNVKGYGHLVGMSQYSADYMARQGSSYEEILLHFFKGATLIMKICRPD